MIIKLKPVLKNTEQPYLEISVDNATSVHVIQTENDFARVEPNFVFEESAVLRQMIVQVTAVHQIQDEAQFVRCLKCVSHAHNERTSLLRRIFTVTRKKPICH